MLAALHLFMATTNNSTAKKHTCRECANVTPVTRFFTLTVHGRQPTLGECPHWELSRCVLLSQRACKLFTPKKESEAVTHP